jgi:hypothetical protein
VCRPLPAVPLVKRRRHLIVVPKTIPAAPRKYFVVCSGRCPRRRAGT